MKLVYYYKENQKQHCEMIECSVKTLNEKCELIKIPITDLFLSIKRKDCMSDTNLLFKTYRYNKNDGIFYMSQNEPSDIMVDEKTRNHIKNLLETI